MKTQEISTVSVRSLFSDGQIRFFGGSGVEIKRVAPETTDVITHARDTQLRGRAESHRVHADQRRRREDDDLIFGAIPKGVMGLISMVALFIMALIFGVRELDMSIPVYIIVLIICAVIGVLLAGSPAFVTIFLGALLLIVGAVTSLLPAVAVGVALMMSASLVIRGD